MSDPTTAACVTDIVAHDDIWLVGCDPCGMLGGYDDRLQAQHAANGHAWSQEAVDAI